MADPRVRIVVEAVTDAAERQMRQLKGTVEDTGKEAAKSGGMFDDFGKTIGKLAAGVGGAAVAFGTLKKAYDFAKEGAAIGQTRESFDRLMASMGEAPDILQQLREASRNTVDDMSLMSSTLLLLAGTSEDLGKKMVDAAPQLLEIAGAAQKLNPAAGDIEFFYSSLAQGIKRSSPLILDNLGLTLKIGPANEAYARAIGKTVEQLTAEEQKMALLNAVLEAGDRMIDQVGGSTEQMGDAFAQLETKVKNATDTLKENFARTILGIADALDRTVDLLFDLDGVMADNQKTALEGADSYEEYALALIRAAEDSGQILQREAKALENYITGVHDAGWRTKELAGEIGLMTERQWGAVQATEAMNENVSGLPNQIDWWRQETEKAIPPVRDLSKDTEDLAGNVELVAQMMADRAARAADDFRGSMDLLHAAIGGEVGQAYEDYQEQLRALDEQLAHNEISAREYKDAVKEQSDAFARNTREIAFNIAEKQILDALEKDLIEDVNNSGTAYDEATGMLWALAEQLGLTDEATIQFMEGVQEATEAVIAGDIKTDSWTQRLDALSGRAGTVRGDLATMADEIRNLPQFKKIVLEYQTKYTQTGTPPPVVDPGTGAPVEVGGNLAFQHGGQFVVRGRAGIDKVPVGFMATRGEVVTVTPVGGVPPPNPVTNNYNLNLTTAQSSMGIQRDFYMMQALMG